MVILVAIQGHVKRIAPTHNRKGGTPRYLRLILIFIGVLSMRSPGVLRISKTPLSLRFLLVRTIILPAGVSLSLTFLIWPGGIFELPKANLILLGAFTSASPLSEPAAFSSLEGTRTNSHTTEPRRAHPRDLRDWSFCFTHHAYCLA